MRKAFIDILAFFDHFYHFLSDKIKSTLIQSAYFILDLFHQFQERYNPPIFYYV